MDSKALRIVYMGTPDFAVMPLRRLVEQGYCVVGVVTVPDKPAGRGLKLHESPVKQYAREVGLPVLQPEKLKNPDFVEALRAWKPDLGVVIAFRMLPEVVWAMPTLGTLNVHASLLPQYRGAAPINWALINGEHESGVTTFLLNREIDTGDILCQARVAIDAQDDAGMLHDKLMVSGTDLLVETIQKIASGEVVPLPQSAVSPDEPLREAPKIFKENSRIDWSRPVAQIHNLVRGLSPYPVAWTELCAREKGDESSAVQVMKIYKTRPEIASHQLAAGTLLTDHKHFLKVAVSDGYLSIMELQLAGKKRMGIEDFLRGFQQIDHYFLK